MDIIKAMNLKKYYTSDTYEVRALDGVSLTVEDGEFIAVVGTSGCGKTTLMNILGGLDTSDFGGVWIRNTSLKDLNKEERTIFRRRNQIERIAAAIPDSQDAAYGRNRLLAHRR